MSNDKVVYMTNSRWPRTDPCGRRRDKYVEMR